MVKDPRGWEGLPRWAWTSGRGPLTPKEPAAMARIAHRPDLPIHFRTFTIYRLRLLLHCGVTWQTHQP